MLQPYLQLTRIPMPARLIGCMCRAVFALVLLAQDLLCNVARTTGEWVGVGGGK